MFFRCPHCNAQNPVPADAKGEVAKCPNCGKSSFVPIASADSPEAVKLLNRISAQLQREHDLLWSIKRELGCLVFIVGMSALALFIFGLSLRVEW